MSGSIVESIRKWSPHCTFRLSSPSCQIHFMESQIINCVTYLDMHVDNYAKTLQWRH